jgi:uncharacterized protein (DUF58 family)
VASFLGRMGLVGLELQLELPDHICARSPVTTHLTLRNTKRRMASYSVQISGGKGSVLSRPAYFACVPAGGAQETTVEVMFARRGEQTPGSFRFSSRFPFGFAERRIELPIKDPMVVYPALEPQPAYEALFDSIAGEAAGFQRGRGHDFYRIRPYEPLESSRHVDWRATAHTGALQVREFTREEEPLVVVAFDLAAPEQDAEWFERAVECAAGLIWRLSGQGARVRFLTQEIDVLLPVESDAYGVLKYLALVERRWSAPLLPAPDDEGVYVLFSAAPGRLSDTTWTRARMVSRDTLPAAVEPPAG